MESLGNIFTPWLQIIFVLHISIFISVFTLTALFLYFFPPWIIGFIIMPTDEGRQAQYISMFPGVPSGICRQLFVAGLIGLVMTVILATCSGRAHSTESCPNCPQSLIDEPGSIVITDDDEVTYLRHGINGSVVCEVILSDCDMQEVIITKRIPVRFAIFYKPGGVTCLCIFRDNP
jgi:hypothetical protein